MIVELCATVILTDASPALWHIPNPDDRSAVHAQALCRISDYCIAHDPARRADIQAALAKARATPGAGAYKEAA